MEELDSGKAGGESLPLVRGAVRIGEGGWRYSVRQEFEAGWRNVTFDDSAWKKGGMPMGYGKGYEVATSLREMEDAVTRVRFRHVFELKSPEVFDDVGLVMTWDDGFIAYLNGHEIGRAGVARGAGESAIGFGRTGAPSTRFFPFEKMRDYLVSGRNVIAIEGHNQAKDSSDYYMGVSFEKFWPVTWKKLPKEAGTVTEAKAKWE